MDLGSFGSVTFDLKFFSAALSIILINLILSGDNAVVIALAVRSLPRKQRLWGMALGSGAAVVLRVVLTFFAAQLLNIAFLKLLGGILITWIAVKLFIEGTEEKKIGEAANLWQAVRLILIADIIMSTDNVLAVAGASHGNLFLLVFGLATSIPFVVGTSALLSMLMDKYPIIVTIGSAILGKVAGELIITDPWVHRMLHPSKALEYGVMAAFAVGVILAGKLLARWKQNREESAPEADKGLPVTPEAARKAEGT